MKFFTGIIAYKKTGNNGTTPSPAILNLVILLHGLYEDLQKYARINPCNIDKFNKIKCVKYSRSHEKGFSESGMLSAWVRRLPLPPPGPPGEPPNPPAPKEKKIRSCIFFF